MRRLGIGVALVLGPLAVFVVLLQPTASQVFGPPSDAVGVGLVLVAIVPLVVVDVRPRAAVVISSARGVRRDAYGSCDDPRGARACSLESDSALTGPVLAPRWIAGLAGVVGIALAPALANTAISLSSTLANGCSRWWRSWRASAWRAASYAIQLEQQFARAGALRAAENRESLRRSACGSPARCMTWWDTRSRRSRCMPGSAPGAWAAIPRARPNR